MKQTVYTASPESQQIHVWRLNAGGHSRWFRSLMYQTGSADGHQPG